MIKYLFFKWPNRYINKNINRFFKFYFWKNILKNNNIKKLFNIFQLKVL